MKDVVSETILAYTASAADYINKNNDIGVMEAEASNFLTKVGGAPKDILDVGCGPGRDVKYFSERGYTVYGIDLCAKFLEKAKEQSPSARLDLMDMRALTYKDNVFDGLWCIASLLHLPHEEAPKAMSEFYRVMKPHATMYLSVLEVDGDKRIDPKYDDKKYGAGIAKHFYRYSQKDFHSLVESSGFAIDWPMSKEAGKIRWLSVLAKKV